MTKVDYAATGSTDQDADHYGVSIAINDSLSVSAAQQSIEFDGTAEDEKNTGIGGSYTMGSISMYGGFNKLENKGGSTSAQDVEASIFNISFAF
jgi:predicted porin